MSEAQAPLAGPQAPSAATPHEAPPSTPAVLDRDQRELLRLVLNRIVPARRDLPGAGDLGVGDSIEHTLAVDIRLRRLFLDGLASIATAAPAPFSDLDAAAQTALLRGVEQQAPAFFAALVDHGYRGYYTQPRVLAAIGLEPRPPQPLGHRLPPFDPELLRQQRDRAPFWRPVSRAPAPAGEQ
ncbi:MAG: gluconate 2-dehydrogenase subunit 3 family protein [Chloroflexi bacterium]|nr:gluconate 2-dehydrogenase subunit 3 family protein [Chloroflexota bacterium]